MFSQVSYAILKPMLFIERDGYRKETTCFTGTKLEHNNLKRYSVQINLCKINYVKLVNVIAITHQSLLYICDLSYLYNTIPVFVIHREHLTR